MKVAAVFLIGAGTHTLMQKLILGGQQGMEMKLIRESIQLEQPLGRGRAVAAVSGEATLPGGLREEARVLATDAMAVVEGTEALQDRVNVSGRVIFRVLYTQGDPSKVSAIEATADFLHPCSLPGAQPRASALANAQVQRADARVVNGRLSMRAEVGLDVRALSAAPVEAVMAVDGLDDVEVRTQSATIRRTASQGSGDTLLREEMALPEELGVRETLYASATAVLGEATGGLGRIGLSGQVLLEAVHASALPGKPLVVTRHSIPFSQSVEISGEDGDLLEGRVTVKDVAVASQEEGSGGQTLRAEVLLGLQGWAEREENVSLLCDAYTTSGDDLHLTNRTIQCRTGSERFSAAESFRTSVLLPDSAPPVRSVLAALVCPVLTGHEQSGGRLNAEGRLDVTLLYMTDGSAAPVSVRLQEPFRAAFSAEAGDDAMLTIAATEADAKPVTSDRIELRCVLRLQGDGILSENVQVITDAQSVAVAPPPEEIVLCFTQPGETLWDIARRYRAPESSVRALNPGLAEEPAAGQGVVIWRRSCATGR